jgi:small subunit ribosomal protein S16
LAVKIRLKKMGSKKRPFFRFVAADVRSPRDGRFIEVLGYYNPMTDPPDVKLDDDKIYKWLNAGAEPTENVAQLLRKAGLLERWQLLKQGVKISELDAVIDERRAKQPSPKSPEEKKMEKIAVASAEKKDAPEVAGAPLEKKESEAAGAPPKDEEKKESEAAGAPPKDEEKKESEAAEAPPKDEEKKESEAAEAPPEDEEKKEPEKTEAPPEDQKE